MASNNEIKLSFLLKPKVKGFFSKFILFLFLLLSTSSSAQLVFIFDRQTGNPLREVMVFDDKRSFTAFTDNIGMVDISNFGENDWINFQLSSFETVRYQKQDISNLMFRIPLIKKPVLPFDQNMIANPLFTNHSVTISREDIAFKNSQTSMDMLSNVDQVFIQKNQLIGGSPMIHGFGAGKIELEVDGISVPNALYNSSNAANFLVAGINSLENIELIIGPSLVKNGNDAIGGVINLNTMRSRYSNDDSWTTSINGLMRYSSANFEKTFHSDFSYYNNKWSVMMSLSFSDFDNLVMGNKHNSYSTRPEFVETINGIDTIKANNKPNEQFFSGYSQLNFISKLGNRVNKYVDWEFSIYLAKSSEVPRYDKQLQYSGDDLTYAVWNYDPMLWVMNTLVINFKYAAKAYDSATFIYAYQGVNQKTSDRKFKDEWLNKSVDQNNIFSLLFDFNKTLRWQNHLDYGLQFIFNNINSSGNSTNILSGDQLPIPSHFPNVRNKSIDIHAFLNYRKIWDKTPITFMSGIAYNFENAKSESNDTLASLPIFENFTSNSNTLTANAGFIYSPGKFHLNFNFSTGFIPPKLSDKTNFFFPSEGKAIVPNTSLDPEIMNSLNLTLGFQFNQGSKIEMNGYYTIMNNAILWREGQINGQDSIWINNEQFKIIQATNTGTAFIYGFGFNTVLKITHLLSFFTNLSYTKGRDDEGFSMQYAPPFFGKSGFIFDQKSFKLEINAAFNATLQYTDLAPAERNLAFLYAQDSNGNPYSPAWYTLNVNSSYRFNEIIFLSLGIENILNYRYRTYASGITAPGLNVIIALRFSI